MDCQRWFATLAVTWLQTFNVSRPSAGRLTDAAAALIVAAMIRTSKRTQQQPRFIAAVARACVRTSSGRL
jgi:hypothetical protein